MKRKSSTMGWTPVTDVEKLLDVQWLDPLWRRRQTLVLVVRQTVNTKSEETRLGARHTS